MSHKRPAESPAEEVSAKEHKTDVSEPEFPVLWVIQGSEVSQDSDSTRLFFVPSEAFGTYLPSRKTFIDVVVHSDRKAMHQCAAQLELRPKASLDEFVAAWIEMLTDRNVVERRVASFWTMTLAEPVSCIICTPDVSS